MNKWVYVWSVFYFFVCVRDFFRCSLINIIVIIIDIIMIVVSFSSSFSLSYSFINWIRQSLRLFSNHFSTDLYKNSLKKASILTQYIHTERETHTYLYTAYLKFKYDNPVKFKEITYFGARKHSYTHVYIA